MEIKVLEEEKRSFFSILAPRVVKVELTVKEDLEEIKQSEKRNKVEIKKEKKMVSLEEIKKAVAQTQAFLDEFIKQIPGTDINYEVEGKEDTVFVTIQGKQLNYLIGYRGDTLNAMQTLLTSIASKGLKDRIRVTLDIEHYRAKREKALEELAGKIAKTVMKTGKSITLEPMTPYERKIIHSKLQNHKRVKTYSTGVEPRRKVVVALK